jgi:hypothetical protein
VARAPPLDVVADEMAGPQDQILQRVEDAAIHVQHAVLEFVPEEMPIDAMRRRGLAAGWAEFLVHAFDRAVAVGANASIEHRDCPPRAMARPIFFRSANDPRADIIAHTAACVDSPQGAVGRCAACYRSARPRIGPGKSAVAADARARLRLRLRLYCLESTKQAAADGLVAHFLIE